ncbi:GTP binding domain [Trinorchestia longiramus]|nr:GTP binding domain [Trinorchestia longiramus]
MQWFSTADKIAVVTQESRLAEEQSSNFEEDLQLYSTEKNSSLPLSPPVLQYLQEDYVYYNSVINNQIGSFAIPQRRALLKKLKKKFSKQSHDDSSPLIVEMQKSLLVRHENYEPVVQENVTQYNFPLSQYFEVEHIKNNDHSEESEPETIDTMTDMTHRMKEYRDGVFPPVSLQCKPQTHLGTEIRHGFSMESVIKTIGRSNYYSEPSEEDLEFWKQLGTSDRSIPQTSVPCGGCGAFFHCHDPSIPGYKPREMIVGIPKSVLRSSVCARCFFLTVHNTALQVSVSPESYIDILSPIKSKRCLVLLLVDLTDAPCSINPDIVKIIATGQPVIVVGSKVDLLPMDTSGCLDRLQNAFQTMIEASSLSAARVVDTCLVSAKTGFGVESLVSCVMENWGTRGDVYLVGSVNSGKSTLFNALVQSDLCVSEAADMLLRATASPWPGTTLNMLKFPLQRCSGKLRFLRKMRLDEELLEQQQKFNSRSASKGVLTTSSSPLTMLTGSVGRTYAKNKLPMETEMRDVFKETSSVPMDVPEIRGLNEKHQRYREKKWFYDTPGVVQPDQFLSLLTHEELQLVLPQATIVPETFRIRRGVSILLGGVARLDVLYVHHPEPDNKELSPDDFVLATVYRSAALPVTVIRTTEAASFYRTHLGTNILAVPRSHGHRLQHWPALQPADTMRVTGMPYFVPMPGKQQLMASADLVLSSAGWISLTVSPLSVCEVRLWTPGARGAYLRSPAFLPHSVLLRGSRFRGCVNYLSPLPEQPDPDEISADTYEIYRMSPNNYAKHMGLINE